MTTVGGTGEGGKKRRKKKVVSSYADSRRTIIGRLREFIGQYRILCYPFPSELFNQNTNLEHQLDVCSSAAATRHDTVVCMTTVAVSLLPAILCRQK